MQDAALKANAGGLRAAMRLAQLVSGEVCDCCADCQVSCL